MAKVLCYTSPARGHLFPTVPILLELARRGHDVVVVTLASEVATLEKLGLRARAMAAAVEEITHDDYGASSPVGALDRAVRVFAERAEHEVADLEAVLAEEAPDLLLVDFNSWGASAVAERSGLPWACFMPYFLPWRLPGLPPFGLGLAPRRGALGRARDWAVGAVLYRLIDRNLPRLNAARARVGLAPLAHMADQGRTAPRVLYYTAEPFEYACPERPESVVMVGPGLWEPESDPPQWLEGEGRPLVLVTCSTEFQDDGALVTTALEALADEDVFVVATTAALDPGALSVPANARVERFVPHSPLLERAACVVCHGGMGITQKALAAGVPVCVVPFGRDQHEVGRHAEVANAGVCLDAKRLTPARLREAVRQARSRSEGARRVADAFRAAGGPERAASELEVLLRPERDASTSRPDHHDAARG